MTRGVDTMRRGLIAIPFAEEREDPGEEDIAENIQRVMKACIGEHSVGIPSASSGLAIGHLRCCVPH